MASRMTDSLVKPFAQSIGLSPDNESSGLESLDFERSTAETGILTAAQPWHILILALALLLIYTTTTYNRLAHIPGPLLASISNIPRFTWVWSRRAHRIHIAQHAQYGSLVRIGPNAVSVSDPKEIAMIYGLTGKYNKSDFYSVILPMSKGKTMPGLFATQDEGVHAMLKKPIAAIYSMSNLVSFEPYVDSTIKVFCEQLDQRFAQTGAMCDFGQWLQYFAFDVVGEITFSKRLGFLERAEDVEGIMASIWHFFEYVAPVGQMPWLDRVWVKNPAVSKMRKPGWNAMAAFALARQRERDDVKESAEGGELNEKDFLSRFLAARAKDPSIPEWAILAWTQSNITAGSDTTAILLRTLFYNLLRHPQTMATLRAELKDAKERGELSEIVAWHESRKLPYLDACIKEAGRIHPPFGLQLERVVPKEGATICGAFLPGGTIVGMNGWVVHRDAATFGEDADIWNPSRWLCEDIERRKTMDRSLLTFGSGHRSCLGKNVSQLEIFKLVPTLLQRYDMALHGDREWQVENRWFVSQFGFEVDLARR